MPIYGTAAGCVVTGAVWVEPVSLQNSLLSLFFPVPGVFSARNEAILRQQAWLRRSFTVLIPWLARAPVQGEQPNELIFAAV